MVCCDLLPLTPGPVVATPVPPPPGPTTWSQTNFAHHHPRMFPPSRYHQLQLAPMVTVTPENPVISAARNHESALPPAPVAAVVLVVAAAPPPPLPIKSISICVVPIVGVYTPDDVDVFTFSNRPDPNKLCIAAKTCASLLGPSTKPASCTIFTSSRCNVLKNAAGNIVGGMPPATLPSVNSPAVVAVLVILPIFLHRKALALKAYID